MLYVPCPERNRNFPQLSSTFSAITSWDLAYHAGMVYTFSNTESHREIRASEMTAADPSASLPGWWWLTLTL
jgi:hypothetical protein